MAAVFFYSNDFYSGDWETATKKITIIKRLIVAFENPLQ